MMGKAIWLESERYEKLNTHTDTSAVILSPHTKNLYLRASPLHIHITSTQDPHKKQKHYVVSLSLKLLHDAIISRVRIMD